LRNALIKKQFGTSINELLSGWKCILLHATDLTASSFKEGGITIPRTAFISPDNRMFTKKVEVLKELEYSSVPNSKCEVDISSIFFMEQRINLRPLSLHCNSTRESSIGTNKTLERAGPSDMKMKIKMADTDDVASPFGLLEELFSNDPWKLLLSTIFLNRTSRSQVDPILHHFLDKWPTASAAVEADLHEMSTLLKPLGLHHQRAAGIIQFSGDYLSLLSHGSVSCTGDGSTFSLPVDASESKSTRLTREDILRIFNCGEYAGDAFKIFIQKCNDFVPTDAVLKVYVEYQRARSLDL
jgi:endonuclease III